MTNDELRDLIASTAKSNEANSTANAELRQEIRELRRAIADQQIEIAQSHREFLEVRDSFSDAIGQMLRISDQQQQSLNFLLERERNRG